MEEKRKYKRVFINSIVMYEIQDDLRDREENLRALEAPTSVDISLGGLKIISKQQLPIGISLKIILTLVTAKVPIKIIGKVVWTKQMKEANTFQTGIIFVEFLNNHEDAVKNYINSMDS